MYKCLLMLTVCVLAQRTYGKSLFDYNVNPEYDLLAEESTSYSNFWPSSEFYESPHYKHHVKRRGHGNSHGHGKGKRKHELPLHSFDISPGYFFPDSSEEFSDEIYHSSHLHPPHPHGLPPGQAKKQGFLPGPLHGHHHGLPPGHAKKHDYFSGPPHGYPHENLHGYPSGHPHEPPRRFPPPPVYDKDFINPWAVPATTPAPFTVQQPPLTTPPAVYVAPKLTTPRAVYVAPKLTTPRTTPAPLDTTTNEKGLIYDIDVRFGRD